MYISSSVGHQCYCCQAAEQQVNPLMSLIWLSCRRNNRSQNTLSRLTESYKIRTRSQPRSQVLSYHIAWFWLRQVHNVTLQTDLLASKVRAKMRFYQLLSKNSPCSVYEAKRDNRLLHKTMMASKRYFSTIAVWPSCKCLSPRGCVMGSFK